MIKLNFRFLFFILLFSLSVSFSLFAEDTAPTSGPEEPEQTDIILPEMYLEIEDLSVEEIDAIIPDDDSLAFLGIEMSLPEPEQIEIPVEVFALSPEDAPDRDGDSSSAGNTPFYCEGAVGGGTSSNITGDINLYYIGEQSSFRLRYFHDGYDGYASQDAGTGYSSREELIEAEIDYTKDRFSSGGEFSFNEFEDGLQGLGDYYSLTRRITNMAADADWNITERLELYSDVTAQYARYRINTASLTPLSYNIFSLDPKAGILFGTDMVSAGFELEYLLKGEGGTYANQDFTANLLFNANPSEYFRIAVEAGVMSDNFEEILFPFFLEFFGTGSFFDYSLSGGYKCGYTDLTELWEIFPAAAGPASVESLGDLPLTRGWFTDAMLRLNISDSFSLSGEMNFSNMTNAVMPSGGSLLNGFSSLVSVDSLCLGAGLGASLDITDNLSFELSWDGQFLEDLNWFIPRHSIIFGFDLNSTDERMGISGNSVFNIYDNSQSWYYKTLMPLIGFDAYLTIADGFILTVSLSDVLAGALDSGRNLWNGYLDKGTVFKAMIKISL